MSKFEDKVMRNFENYVKLQKSGKVNMVSSEVQKKLNISKEEHQFIIKNYDAIYEEFSQLKVVDELIADAKARVEGGGKEEKTMGFNKPDPDADYN